MNYIKIGLGSSMVMLMSIGHSFALFGFGKSENTISAFVPANSIDNTSVTMTQNAMTMITGKPVGAVVVSPNLDSNTDTGNLLDPEKLLTYNLLALVESSNNKTEIVDNYIQNLNKSASQLNQLSQSYQSRIEQSQAVLADCTLSKTTSDGQVIVAINTSQLENIDILINGSVVAGECISKHTIISNAYSLMLAKTQRYVQLLTQTSTLVAQNQAIIIQYPEVISDPAVITQIRELSSKL